MRKKNIFLFVNSYIGKKGSIGYRAGNILSKNSIANYNFYCFCKSAKHNSKKITFVSMPFFKLFIQLLKFLRQLSFNAFNHRLIDIYLFETLCLIYLKIFYRDKVIDIAHVWDYCPRLIDYLKNKGANVYLDVPIAPAQYAENISKKYHLDFFKQNKNLIKIQKNAYNAAELIVVPSMFVCNELINIGIRKKKIIIIEFGAHKIKKYKTKINKKNEKINFCYLGVASKRKGLLDLLEVWNSDDFKNDLLHIVGRVNSDIFGHIKLANRNSNIILHGFVNPNLPLSKSHIFVFPSWMEGSSKAVYEAMSWALPCIVTKSSGSIIKDRHNGFLYDAGDNSKLKKLMIYLKNNKNVREEIGNKARKTINTYNWDRYINKIYKIYEL